jgi:hypothetical protein
MNKSLRWKLILAFVLIFLAGAACGFFGAVHMHRAFSRTWLQIPWRNI